MFESMEEEIRKSEGTEPLRNRVIGIAVVILVTVVILSALYAAIVYLG